MAKRHFSRIPVASLGTLSNRIIELAENSKLDEVLKSEKFQTLLKINETYQQSVLKKKNSDLTKDIEEADNQRDYILKSFRKHINASAVSIVPEIKSAGEKAKAILDRFGNDIEKLPYAEESAYIVKIISEFKSDDVADIAEALNLPLWIRSLDRTQNAFEELFKQRSLDEHTLGEVASASELRKEVVDAIINLHSYIENGAGFKGDKSWKDLEEVIAESIEKTAK